MSSVLSTLATTLATALIKGPVFGDSGVATPTALHVLSESASIPVGAPSVVSATDYVRFGIIPKGARIIRSLSYLSSDHTATVSGKLQFAPVDGVGTTQEIATVVANIEATETTSVPDAAAEVTLTEDCWVQWVPAADLTIATTAKVFRLRLSYALPY
jgi:hypothetical protein